MKKEEYTKEVLLDLLGSYLRQISRSGNEHPTAVLSDLQASMKSVLKANDYKGRYKSEIIDDEKEAMREKIKEVMDELMQDNCKCNYVLVQNGTETFVKNISALDAYMKAYEMSKDGDILCYVAALGKHNKAACPVFSVTSKVAILSGRILY